MSINKIKELEMKLKEKRLSKSDYTENQPEPQQIETEKKEIVTGGDRFRFDNLIDDISDVIYNHSVASYLQIHLKVIQNLAFLFSYGGIHKFKNLGFYGYDFSPTGTAKSDVIKHSRNLLLRPVIKEVEKLHKEELEKATEEKREPTLYRVVNTTQTSPEALFEAFQNIPVQMMESEEFGKYLKQQTPLIEYIISLYGKNEIQIPSYKNKKTITKHLIEKVDFFFYGASTLRYLTINKFYEELEGGLLNRGIIVYNPKLREFEETPKEFKIPKEKITFYNAIAKGILDFANISDFNISYSFKDNKLYEAFARDIYNKRKELILINNPFANLYARIMQNFDSVLFTIALIEFYQQGYYENTIKESIIEKTIEYFKVILENNEELIEYLLNYKENQNTALTFKIVSKAKEVIAKKGYCTLRDIYKPLKLSKNKVLYLLKEYNQENGEFALKEKGKSVEITLL